MKVKVKKVLATMLVAVMLLSAAPLSGIDLGIVAKAAATELAESGQCGSNASYTFEAATGTLTISGTGEIDDSSFIDSEKVKIVIIEDGITGIGHYTFANCRNLTSITIGSGVSEYLISVGDGFNAFENCTSLERIQISKDNKVLDSRNDCNAIIETSTNTLLLGCKNTVIPKGIIEIDVFAFKDCSGLTKLVIPNGVKKINDYAFNGCSELTSITIPESVSVIGNFSFEDCTKLNTIIIPDSIEYFGIGAFYNTGYYNNNKNWENDVLYINHFLISARRTLSGSYNIKEGTKAIATSAFSGCWNVTNITIPDSVTDIGIDAFESCSGLKSINIPNHIAYLGRTAFVYCTALESITIPEGITSIQYGTFYGCASLTSVTLPQSIKIIEYMAFSGCASLAEIEIPDGVLHIQSSAFSDCEKLSRISLPNSLLALGERAFSGCKSLKSITLPDSISNIVELAFENSGLESIVFPNNSSAKIGSEIFYGCKKLTKATIPNSMISLNSDVFVGTELYENEANWENGVLYVDNILIKAKETLSGSYCIKDGTKAIASCAFEDCTALTSITVPSSVTNIGSAVFRGCTNLENVIIPEDINKIGAVIFNDTAYYNNADNWDKDVLYIGDYLISAKSTLSGEYKIKDGTKLIAAGAFADSEISKVDIPNGITDIGDGTFAYCRSLTEINIPNSVKYIDEEAFYDCIALRNITIPDSVIDIGTYAFFGCINLSSVKLSNNLANISDCMFLDCENIEEISLPSSIKSIGSYAFGDCIKLKKITIPDGTEFIGYWTFGSCEKLESVTISNSVKYISESAFVYCSGLSDIYFIGSQKEWKAAYAGKYTGSGIGGMTEYNTVLNATIHYVGTAVASVTCDKPVSRGFNQFKFEVIGRASKIQLVNADGLTYTVSRYSTLSTDSQVKGLVAIKSYDIYGREVSGGSADIAYEIWTINLNLAEGDYSAKAKYDNEWDSSIKNFTIAYDFGATVSSVKLNGTANGGFNKYAIKVVGEAAKIQVISADGGTYTFNRNTLSMGDKSRGVVSIKAYDKKNNEVEVGSDEAAYELWVINMALKEGNYTVKAKFNNEWEENGKTFTVKYPTAALSEVKVSNASGKDGSYSFTVNGSAQKIQIAYASGATLTYSKSSSNVSVKYYNAKNVEVDKNSGEAAYEVWTINRNLTDGRYTVLAKYNNGSTYVWGTTALSFGIEQGGLTA